MAAVSNEVAAVALVIGALALGAQSSAPGSRFPRTKTTVSPPALRARDRQPRAQAHVQAACELDALCPARRPDRGGVASDHAAHDDDGGYGGARCRWAGLMMLWPRSLEKQARQQHGRQGQGTDQTVGSATLTKALAVDSRARAGFADLFAPRTSATQARQAEGEHI
eukprot:scaffold119236_cov61-Phaeocystis_antarctica.AAC.5